MAHSDKNNGGESTLVALLLQKGYLKCTVASKEAYRLPHFVFNFGKTVYVD